MWHPEGQIRPERHVRRTTHLQNKVLAIIPLDPPRPPSISSYVDEVVAALVGAGGLWFQITRGFTLPFPFDILLLPVSILEGFLRWQITFFTPDDNAMSALSG